MLFGLLGKAGRERGGSIEKIHNDLKNTHKRGVTAGGDDAEEDEVLEVRVADDFVQKINPNRALGLNFEVTVTDWAV